MILEINALLTVGVYLVIVILVTRDGRYTQGFRMIYPTALGLLTVIVFLVSIFEALYDRRVDCLAGVILGLVIAAFFGYSIEDFRRAKRRGWKPLLTDRESLDRRIGEVLAKWAANQERIKQEGTEEQNDDGSTVS